MKSKIIKSLVVAGLAVASPLAFVGCGEVAVKNYNVTGHNQTYYVNDSFSIVGMKLVLTMSDGNVKEVTITESMIKEMPDMSTAGVKHVAVDYEGKTYTFSFQVVEPSPESAPVYEIIGFSGIKLSYTEGDTEVELEPGAKITFIRTNLTTGEVALTKNMISGFDASTPGNKTFTITYDGKTLSVPYVVISLYEDQMKQLLQDFLAKYNAQSKTGSTSVGLSYSADFKYLQDQVHYQDSYSSSLKESDINANKTIYDALIKGVVNSALNGKDFNALEMTSKLEIIDALKSVKTNIENIDYYNYIVNETILTEPDAYYTALVRDYLCDGLDIKVAKGKDAVYSLAISTLDKIRNNEEIDVMELVESLNKIVQKYSTNEGVKLVISGLLDSTKLYIQEFGTKHALSYVISQSSKLFIYEEYNFDIYEWEVVENEELQEEYAILLSNLIYEVENIKYTNNYSKTIQDIDECLTDLIEFETLVGKKEYPDDAGVYIENYIIGYNKYQFMEIQESIENAKLFEVAAVLDAINKDGAIAVAADMAGLNGKAVSLVFDYLVCQIKNEPMDYEQFIIDYCFELGLNPTEYLAEYRTSGNVQIITAGLNNMFNQYDAHDFTAKDELLDLARYADSLQTEKIDAEILLQKLSAYYSAYHDWLVEEIPEAKDSILEFKLMADITANGLNGKAHIEYFGNLLSSLALPEGAINCEARYNSVSEINGGDIVTYKETNDYVAGDILSLNVYYGTDFKRLLGVIEEYGVTYYICRGDNWLDAVNPENPSQASWQEDAEYVQGLINEGKTLNEIKSLTRNCQFVPEEEVLGEVIAVNKHILNVPSSFVDAVTEFLVSNKTEQDVETLIKEICKLTGADSEQLYQYYKDGVLLQTMFDTFYYFETQTSTPNGEEPVEEPIDPKEEAMYTAYRNILVYIDSAMHTGEYNNSDLIKKVNLFADASITYAESLEDMDNMKELLAYKALYYATLGDATASTIINNLVEEYSVELKSMLVFNIATILQLEEGTVGYEAVNYFATKHTNNYINGSLDMKVVLEDFFTIVDTYCEDDVKVYSKSVSIMIGAMFYNEEIDYNELFAFVELPEGIESIDYNKLVAKLVNEDTYKILSINGVEVKHVVEDGELVKEILTLQFNVDFDMLMLSQVHANGTITLEVAF